MIRSIMEFTLKKPILNHIFLLFLLVVSIFSYNNIPKEIFPPSNLDFIDIYGTYAGASADTLDNMVVKSIEDDLKNLSDVAEINSIIKNGTFTIEVKLKDDVVVSEVLDDIKDIIATIKQNLPSDMNEPIAKLRKQAFPLLLIAIAGDENKKRLLSIADELKSELSSIKDLSTIAIRGDSDEELVFTLNEKFIDSYGLNKSQVINSLASLSSIFPIGTIKERGEHLFVSTLNGEKDIEAIKNTLLKIGEKRVYVKDISDVKFTLSDSDQLSHFNGKPTLSLDIQKSKFGNAIALSKEIKEILKRYETKYQDLEFKAYTDTSIWIKNRLNTVISNITFGLGLVFLVMYFFVDLRIAIVVVIGIPTSFMIGLIVTDYFGYSLNMLSLLGVLIALGMLVDEAIVVAENIHRHLQMGKSPVDATLDGAVEMFPAVVTATTTTIFAFLPMSILSGSMGVFLKILPVMISILLLSSLFEAFFFLPLHSKDMLKLSKRQDKSEKIWIVLNGIYKAILYFLLKRKFISLISILAITIFSTAIILKSSKFQLFPEFDTTQIFINGKVNVNSELKDTEEIVTLLEKELLSKLPKSEVSSVTSVIGLKLDQQNRAEFADYYFQIFVNLYEQAPKDVFNKYINPYLAPEYDSTDMIRIKDAKEIGEIATKIAEPFKKLYNEQDMLLFEELNVIVPQTGIIKSDVEIAISSDDESIKKAVKILESKMQEIKGVSNINNDLFDGEMELKLKINQYGQQLGFNENEIFTQLRAFYLKGEVSKMFNESGLLKVKTESIQKDFQESILDFTLNIPNTNSKVKLQDVSEFIYRPSFAKIIKDNGERIRTIYASLDKDIITSSEFLKTIQPNLDEITKYCKVTIKGEQKESQNVQKEIAQAAVIALFLIFISLVWMFDSIAKPLMIISTIPLTMIGVLIGHIIIGINLSLPSLIGVVGLAGVVVNDGIIMIDFLKNIKTKDELIDGAKLRLKPILLTSITTIIGLSTLIFFPTGQSLLLQPMAVTIGFGLIWATLLNLYYIPTLFSVIYKIK